MVFTVLLFPVIVCIGVICAGARFRRFHARPFGQEEPIPEEIKEQKEKALMHWIDNQVAVRRGGATTISTHTQTGGRHACGLEGG